MEMDSFRCIKDFEERSIQVLPESAAGFFNSGADSEQTLRENCESFSKWHFRPRTLMRDVSNIDLSVSIMGDELNFPICIAPTSLSKLASYRVFDTRYFIHDEFDQYSLEY